MVPKDGDTKIELEIENMHIIIDKIKEHQVEHAIIEIFR
jgi:putative hemolysin